MPAATVHPSDVNSSKFTSQSRKKKRVFIIRHGVSKAQEVQSSSGVERRTTQGKALLDCALSDAGFQQARDLNKRSREALEHADLVVTSPLTRAIQTACICFEGIDVPIIAHPGLAEFPISHRMGGFENIGRSMDELAQDVNLTALPNFSNIDFSHRDLTGDVEWWHAKLDKQAVVKRLRAFLHWLDQRDEANIVLVGHCMSFMCLQHTFQKVPNCKLLECRFFEGGCMTDPKLRPNVSTKEHLKKGCILWSHWFYLIKKPKDHQMSIRRISTNG